MANTYNQDFQSNNVDLQSILNTINALPSVTDQEPPAITVSSDGLITAISGTQYATEQLPTRGAETITPSRLLQIAANKGVYTTGVINVAGDSNLVSENIKSGVSIFGVAGSYEGSGTVVETCGVYISGSTGNRLTVNYVDSSFTRKTISSISGTTTIQPLKNSIIVVSSSALSMNSSLNASGSISFVASNGTLSTYFVTGSAGVSVGNSSIISEI